MTLKEKAKTYSFWISLVSAILILVRTVAEYFGKTINNNLILSIATGVCGVLVIVGLLSGPKNKKITLEELTKETENIKENTSQIVNQVKEDISSNMEMTIQEQLEYLKNLKVNAENTDNQSEEEKPVIEEQIEDEQNVQTNLCEEMVEKEIQIKEPKQEEHPLADGEEGTQFEKIVEDNVDQTTLLEEVQQQETNQEVKHQNMLRSFCNEDFSKEELKELLQLIIEKFE